MSKTFVFLIILILGEGFYFLKQTMFKKPEIEIKLENKTKEKLPSPISIVTLYDNYQFNPQLKTGWGFSCLIEIRENEKTQRILFDTGADSETLFFNMEKMGILPKEIDFVFISHLHQDHIGGLSEILKIKPDLKVYKPENFSGPQEIIKGVWTTGPLGTFIKEQSLILNSKRGLIIITGCAHPGILNILKKTKEMFPNEELYLVLGGFHLFESSDKELKTIINEFKNLNVQKVAPCHCSGDKCRELLKKEYKENFIENGAGKIIEI